MSKEIKQMTVSQALAEGYEYCSDGEEYFTKIEKDLFEDEWAGEFRGTLYVAEKEGYKYQLSVSDVEGLFQNEFEGQDEVYDEDLGGNIEKETYQKIADMINAHLTKTYHDITEIELIPDPPTTSIHSK